MRIFALSDVHADFEPNARWLKDLSLYDYQADLLILAGDLTDSLPLLEWCLGLVARRFRKVLFVPGNHELWTLRDRSRGGSFEKFELVCEAVRNSGVSMETHREARLSVVPLLSWYDYSFGMPSHELENLWMDFHACTWPPGCDPSEVNRRFLALNEAALRHPMPEAHAPDESAGNGSRTVISFSHFLPRQELVPKRSAALGLDLSPVMGSTLLDLQVRQSGSMVHIYGHSHVNRKLAIDAVTYVNNAFGYPEESKSTAKRLLCVYEL